MPTTKPCVVHTSVHEISTRKPDYIDILTVLLPVATFLLGYILTGLVEKRKEKKRLADTKEYFLALAGSLVAAGREQSVRIMDAVSRLQHLKGNNFGISKMAGLVDERIKSIPNLDLYKIFVTRKGDINVKVAQLNTLSDVLIGIESAKIIINNHNDKIRLTTEPFYDNYLKTINSILGMRDNLNHKLNMNEILNRVNAENIIDIIDDIITSHDEPNIEKFNEILYMHETVGKPFYDSPRLQFIDKAADKDIGGIFLAANELKSLYLNFSNATAMMGKHLTKLNNDLVQDVHILSALINKLQE